MKACFTVSHLAKRPRSDSITNKVQVHCLLFLTTKAVHPDFSVIFSIICYKQKNAYRISFSLSRYFSIRSGPHEFDPMPDTL